MKKGFLPALALLIPILCSSCCKEQGNGKDNNGGKQATRPAGIAVRYAGLDIPVRQVDQFLPYMKDYRSNEAENSLKRYILESYVIPLARARACYAREYKDTETTALNWLQELKAGALDIKTLARRQAASYNNDKTPQGAGEPVERARSILPVAVGQALFRAKPGDFIGPVGTHMGWHLFKVHSFRSGITRDLDRVTFQEAFIAPGGIKHVKTFGKFTDLKKGSIQIIDPAYSDIVTFLYQSPGTKEKNQ